MLIEFAFRRRKREILKVKSCLQTCVNLEAKKAKTERQVRCNQIPQPRAFIQQLLKAAKVALPEVFPSRGVTVTTKKKLAYRRNKR